MNPTRLLAILMFLNLGPLFARATIVLSDSLDTGVGSAPPGWTIASNDQWRIRAYTGGVTLANLESPNSGASGRKLTRDFSPAADSWILDFGYAWQWGGSTANGGYGFHSMQIDADMLDAAGNGYRLRVHQGNQNNPDNTAKTIRIYKVTGANVFLLAEGPGYNLPGWKTLGLSTPNLRRVRFAWDHSTRTVSAWRDLGGGWERVASASDTTSPIFARLVLNPSSFINSCAPQIDNVVLDRPTPLAWGVCGHPGWIPYRDIPAATQLQRLTELGATIYRLDAHYPPHFDAVLAAADDVGVKILPILYPSSHTNPDKTPAMLYAESRAIGEAFATTYAGRFTHIEMGNELEIDALVGNQSGAAISHYDAAKLDRIAATLKGLADGIHSVSPSVQRIVNTAGWYHYGFLDAMLQRDVPFEVIGWHWYSEMGSMQRIMRKLTTYGKPIWVTEFNRRNGSYRGLQDADDFTAGTPGADPAGWTLTGNWKVEAYGANKLVTDFASTGTLARVISPAANTSWELAFRYAWQWGGSTTHGTGAYPLAIDADMVNTTGYGYRLRVHQGNGNNPANDNQLMELFRVTPSGSVRIAQGGGNNKPGWKSRGLATPDLNRVKFRWSKGATENKLSATWIGPAGETAVFNITDNTYGVFDHLVLRASGYSNSEKPQFDDVLLHVNNPDISEAEQAVVMTEMAHEMSNLPGVEAIILYELFDEPSHPPTSGEAYYGLHRILKNPSTGKYGIGTVRPGYNALKNFITTRGVLPPDGGLLVDDSAYSPAFTTTGLWNHSSEADPYYFYGYTKTPAAPLGSASARFSPVVPKSGLYAVSAHIPASASHAASAPVTIVHAGGAWNGMINQQTGGWVHLGDFTFDVAEAGGGHFIEIGNATDGESVADAVKLHKK